MKYAYYPGCSLHSTAKEYGVSAQAVCQLLEIELEEVPRWTCCGATSAHSIDRLLSVALPVKYCLEASHRQCTSAKPCQLKRILFHPSVLAE